LCIKKKKKKGVWRILVTILPGWGWECCKFSALIKGFEGWSVLLS